MKPYPSVGLGSIVPVRVRDTQLIEHGDVEDAVRLGCCSGEEFIGLHRRETANSMIQSQPTELAPATWNYPKPATQVGEKERRSGVFDVFVEAGGLGGGLGVADHLRALLLGFAPLEEGRD